MTEQLRIELLGPLRVLRNEQPVAVGAHRLQALLAVLALRANQVCLPEELLDLVWHDNPPGTGLKVLPPYIYRLRRALPADVLDRTSEGYVLHLPPGSLDIADFETTAAEASRLRDTGDLDAAAAEYTRALARFRGEPLTGLPGPYLAAQRHRLLERRDRVRGDRIDVDLDRGRAAELVAELVPAVAARPFDERLAGQLMRAFAADGRQAEALDVYRRTRRALIDELGVEPGQTLRDIHQRVLRNQEAARTRDELPYAGAVFVGRNHELDVLVQALGNAGTAGPPVVAVDGMGGVGKTALVVHTARRSTARYPDGVLYIDLHGHSAGHPPRHAKAALDQLLVGAGVVANAIPPSLEAAQSLWRTTVADRRMLIVLDNAASSSTVLPLLPGTPTCGVLITSRNQLTGLDVRERLHLDLLDPTDASELLAQLVGAARAGEDVASSNGLIERCGRLPLALRIAGARLRHRPSWTVAYVNERLDRAGRRLSELSADGIGVTATFELSYEQLDPDQRRFFRLLSLVPGRDFDQYGAAALGGLDPDEASDLAESLVDANLLLEPTPGRYQFHDLIRAYTDELASRTDPAELLTAATDRLVEYYRQAALHPLSRLVVPKYFELGDGPPMAVPEIGDAAQSIAWADAESDNLAAAVEYSAGTEQHTRTWQLAVVTASYLCRRGKVQQQDRVLELALRAAVRLGDRDAEARVHLATGRLVRGQRGVSAAVDAFRKALERRPADGDPLLQAQIYSGLGHALQAVDPYGEALPTLLEATRLARELDEDLLLAQTLAFTGILHSNQLDYDAARAAFQESIELYRRLGPTGVTADALSALAACYIGLDRAEDAIETATAALDLAIELGNTFSLPGALTNLGRAQLLRGDLELALSIHRRAITAAEKSGIRQLVRVARLYLGQTLLAQGDTAGALALFGPLLETALEEKDHLMLLKAREAVADHALAVDDPVTAADHLRAALAVAEEFHPPHAVRLREKLDAATE